MHVTVLFIKIASPDYRKCIMYKGRCLEKKGEMVKSLDNMNISKTLVLRLTQVDIRIWEELSKSVYLNVVSSVQILAWDEFFFGKF